MNLHLAPIDVTNAVRFLTDKDCDFELKSAAFAISVKDNDGEIHGVILMGMGKECYLVHMYTDGTALAGSILYGGAWRAAKALGYSHIKI